MNCKLSRNLHTQYLESVIRVSILLQTYSQINHEYENLVIVSLNINRVIFRDGEKDKITSKIVPFFWLFLSLVELTQ